MRVTAGDGTELACHEWGAADAPTALLLHGWAAEAYSWRGVSTDQLRLIAPDLRGHGSSDQPLDGYRDSARWASDVAALVESVGSAPVLVGWSYGGLVVTDYIRHHGTSAIAGIVLVGAITEIGRGHPGGHVGPAMREALPAALSEDPDVAVPALTGLARKMTASARAGADVQRAISASLRVPPSVRAAMFHREVDSAEVLASIDVPTLVVHGTADEVVDPKAAEYAAGLIPGVQTRWYDGVGHMPFAERVEDFTADLVTFAHSALTTKAGS